MYDPQAIREATNRARRSIPSKQLQLNADALAQRLLNLVELQGVKTVAGYRAVRGEIDLTPSFEALWARGVEVFLPIVEGESLHFAKWHQGEVLLKRGLGLFEPDVPREQLRKGTDLDLVLAPLVAFDDRCQRIGMGGGFYDRSFECRRFGAKSPVLIGVAHELQKQPQIVAEPWDVQMDMIVTEKAIYRCP